MRRIEALTYIRVYNFVTQQYAALTTIADVLKHSKDLVQAIENMINEKKKTVTETVNCLPSQSYTTGHSATAKSILE